MSAETLLVPTVWSERLGGRHDEGGKLPMIGGLDDEVGGAEARQLLAVPRVAREDALDPCGAGIEWADLQAVNGRGGVARLAQLGGLARVEMRHSFPIWHH